MGLTMNFCYGNKMVGWRKIYFANLDSPSGRADYCNDSGAVKSALIWGDLTVGDSR